MKKRLIALILCIIVLISTGACSNLSKDSYFNIYFIDVGQGDSALIECDGHYMLIDGGKTSASDKVANFLKRKKVKTLDIVAISHLHDDHYGGLINGLDSVARINLTISNATCKDTQDLENILSSKHSHIKIPSVNAKYNLGSAVVRVIDVSSTNDNDSLVLMVEYGETRFLFTGDIEETQQTKISDKYENANDEAYKIDLIKMPHHGSYTGTLYRFLRTFMPDYAVISAGMGNQYGHPHNETLDLLKNKELKIELYRTDKLGDIIATSDGKKVIVKKYK